MENYDLELNKAVEQIKESNAKLVCIQLPDGLKPKAKEIQDYMMDKGKFMGEDDSPDLATGFNDLFLYGTITTGVLTETMNLMENNTFLNWTERMKVQANKTDIEVEFTVNSVTISQSEPWKVDVSVDLIINIQDKKGTASWTIGGTTGKTYTQQINITAPTGAKKFVDPLYLIDSNGIVNNTITITHVDPSSSTANLETHLLNSYYIENSDAPSYLMRFENDFSSSSDGIESLANLQKFIDKGLSISSKSVVDHIYFDSSSSTTDCNVKFLEVYAWFYLDHLPDPDHLDFYNARCKGSS